LRIVAVKKINVGFSDFGGGSSSGKPAKIVRRITELGSKDAMPNDCPPSFYAVFEYHVLESKDDPQRETPDRPMPFQVEAFWSKEDADKYVAAAEAKQKKPDSLMSAEARWAVVEVRLPSEEPRGRR
jgi:hypothetical protein